MVSIVFTLAGSVDTYYDLHPGAVIEEPYVARQRGLQRMDVQSLRVVLPEVAPDKSIRVSTGCATADGPGVHVLPMNTRCLVDGRATVYVDTWGGAGAQEAIVTDLTVGKSSEAPLEVAIPDLRDIATTSTLSIDVLASGTRAFAEIDALWGPDSAALTNRSVQIPASADGPTIFEVPLSVGHATWLQNAGIFRDVEGFEEPWGSVKVETLGETLPEAQTFRASDYLPLPESLLVNGNEIAWRWPDQALEQADCIVVLAFYKTPEEQTVVWRAVVPSTRSSVIMPEVPMLSPAQTFERVEVLLADQDAAVGWADALSHWEAENAAFSGSAELWAMGRYARAVWNAPAK
jgi:hypothetical protein